MVLSTDRGHSALKRAWGSYKAVLDEGAERMHWLAEWWFAFVIWVKFRQKDGEEGWFDDETWTIHVRGGDRDDTDLGELKEGVVYIGALLAFAVVVLVYNIQFDLLDPAPPTRADMLRNVVSLAVLWMGFVILHLGQDIDIEREADD